VRSVTALAGGSVGGDRKSLTLHTHDEDLLLAVVAANPRTVAVVMCGSAVLMERWREVVPAILILWYPGMEGGHALADVVLGKEKPTGRLPFAIPTSAEHLPPFDPKAKVVEYGPLHGQALLDSMGVEAAFPYGFGLSYE
jgi:beta-glucosidase